MESKIKEALGLMEYRRFWHRDHERNCDVVCVDFKPALTPAGDNGKASAELAKRTDDTRGFVDFLRAHSIESYVHYGPTGAIFAAIVCSDESKRILERLSRAERKNDGQADFNEDRKCRRLNRTCGRG